MILVSGYLQVALDDGAFISRSCTKLMEASRLHPGCSEFVISEDVGSAGLFHLFALFSDRTALDRHLDSEAVRTFLLDRSEAVVFGRRVRWWEADGPGDSLRHS